jgi:hypothetical protein
MYANSSEATKPALEEWQRLKWLVVPLLLVWCGVGLLVAYRDLKARRARNSIVEFLRASDQSFGITVNGNSWGADKDLLEAVRHIHSEPGHHSHPEHHVFVEVQGTRGKLELLFARDSDNPGEYWVFWAKDVGNESRMEIGRVNTTVLDKE